MLQRPCSRIVLVLVAAFPACLFSADLKERVEGLIAKKAPSRWQVGVAILDDHQKPRVLAGGDRVLAPASNQKILVAGAALGLLGPDFRYQTELAVASPPRDGAVRDLVVRGDGDPNISDRFYNGDPTSLFKAWAAKLKAGGVTRVTGDLVVDDSRFDSVRFGPGWKENQAGRWYSAEVGALNLNDNCVDITVRPSKPGELAHVELRPATAYLSVENQCRTVAGSAKEPIFHRKVGTNVIQVRGEMPARRKEYSDAVTIQDPGLYFGTVLAEVLRAEGISIDGKVARGTLAERAGPNPTVLHTHTSSLTQDLSVINKRSQNLHAEVLLKALGARVAKEGSVAGGAKAIASFLERESIPAAGLKVDDGSGLSAGNRVTAATLAGILGYIQRQPYFKTYLDSLPVGGKDGTLSKRFRGRKSLGHVFAKTGYIAGVSALSGYVERGGKHWVFSVLVNGLNTGGRRSADIALARALEEEIAEEIYLSLEP